MLLEIVVFEDAIAENLAHGLVNVPRQRRSLVVEGDDGAEQLQLGVRPRADPVHGLEQVVRALEREVARLHGDQQCVAATSAFTVMSPSAGGVSMTTNSYVSFTVCSRSFSR